MADNKLTDRKSCDISSLSTNILETILREDLNSKPEDRLTPEEIQYIVSILKKREEEADAYESVDLAEAWKQLEAKIHFTTKDRITISPEDCESTAHQPPKDAEIITAVRLRFKALRKFTVVAAIIGIWFAMMITAQAFGVDVFGAIGHWTDETFQFISSLSKKDYVSEESETKLADKSQSEIMSGLDYYGIQGNLIPTWYPDGFELSEETVITNDTYRMLLYHFENGIQNTFTIQFIRFSNTADMDAFVQEKDDAAVRQYESSGKTFYLMSNLDWQNAIWSDGSKLVMVISGNITESEIITMIDSIGE